MSEPSQRLVATYLEQDRKAEIDWSDAQQRREQLQVLVTDAEAALELATAEVVTEEVRLSGWLLTKILGDDTEVDEQGRPRLAEGTAEDRIISLTEPEMRHGRKSASRRFNGFKTSLATEPESELLLDLADMSAAAGDGAELLPTIDRVEQQGLRVDRAIGDGAYPSGDNLAACATYPAHPVDLVGPLGRGPDPRVDKAAFEIDLEQERITCPYGHQTTGGDDPLPGRSVPPAPCSRPVSAARPTVAPSPPTPRNGTSRQLASVRKRPSSKSCTACAVGWNARLPNWSATACARPATAARLNDNSSGSGPAQWLT